MPVMSIGAILLLSRDIIAVLEASGVLKKDGTFDVSNITADLKMVKAIEEIFAKYGLVVPVKVDAFLAALPLFVTMFQ